MSGYHSRNVTESNPRLSPAVARLLPALLAPLAALLVTLGGRFPSLAPAGPLPQPGWTATLALGMLLLSLYRPRLPGEGPSSPSLRLGAAVAPPLIVLSGAAPAATAAGLALLVRPWLHRALARKCGLHRDRPDLVSALSAAGGGALVILGTGAAWSWLSPVTAAWTADPSSTAVVVSTTFLYLMLLVLACWLVTLTDDAVHLPAILRRLLPLDLAGWLLGLVVTLVAVGTNGGLAALLLFALSALGLEAERQRLLRRAAEQRVEELDRVREAGDRMVTDNAGHIDRVVERIAEECGNVLPWLWFQLELTPQPGEPPPEVSSWWAGPDQTVQVGTPRPDPHPPTLPGMHKRAAWRVVERPLAAEDQPVGHLRLWCDPRRLEEGDLALFDNLLPHMAASVQRALLDREAREDPLTGVAVRRVLERRLQEVYRRVVEEGGSMAVLMCDLDHFKRINDTFGHDAGDLALQAATQAFESALRHRAAGHEDLLARYGGEEFTVLLEGARGADALAVAERLRKAVEAAEVRDPDTDRKIPLTVSVGVAAYPELHIKTPTELVLLADGALYEAKRQGRNQVLLDLGQGHYRNGQDEQVLAETPPLPPTPPQIFS